MGKTIVAILSRIAGAIFLVVLGEERQKREQAEADNEMLKKHADIDRKPDVADPFGLLRKK